MDGNTFALPISLIMTGFILGMVGLISAINSKRGRSDCVERVEATVTKLSARANSPTAIPEAEYMLDGKPIKAHYAFALPKTAVNFNVGDTITVLINPKYPHLFYLEEFKTSDKTSKYFIGLSVCGAILAAAGIVCMIVLSLSS